MQPPALAAAQILRDRGVNQQQLGAGSSLLSWKIWTDARNERYQFPNTCLYGTTCMKWRKPLNYFPTLFLELQPKIQLYFDKYWQHDVVGLSIGCPNIFQVKATLPMWLLFFLACLGPSESTQFLFPIIMIIKVLLPVRPSQINSPSDT